MNFRDLVLKTRSYRRFLEDEPVPMETLESLVDLARCTASAANFQPLKYVLCCEKEKNAAIFQSLGWAAYLAKWPGPKEGERPAAYIVICLDESITDKVICDQGIAAQTIMLGATELGLGGCILGSVNRENLNAVLDLPPNMRILLVLALGRPAERAEIEPLGEEGSIKYYRDDKDVHKVPKRSLKDIILAQYA